MKTFRVGLIQTNLRSAFDEADTQLRAFADLRTDMGESDFAHNRDLVAAMAAEAVAAGAELLLVPETYVDGWSAKPSVMDKVLAPVPGRETEFLSALARKLNVWICAGIYESFAGGTFNSAVLISDTGRIEGVYRKTHETQDVLRRMPYALGDALPVFETPWGRAGILICHDRWYPENARTLKSKGAELVLNPSCSAVFMPHHKYYELNLAVLRSHAYLNELFWINCNAANHGGNSLVIGPAGDVIEQGELRSQAIVATIDAQSYSLGNFFLPNLRPELYQEAYGMASSYQNRL